MAGAALVALLAVAGCAPSISQTDFVAGASGGEATDGAGVVAGGAAEWSLSDIVVAVRENMPIHEDENVRYPSGDRLVWWGDPPGDRVAQVETLMADALQAGALDALTGAKPVVIRMDIQQFHAMTPRARATNIQLGVHEIVFDLSVIDAATGEVIVKEDGVSADLRAFSGSQALMAEQVGQGQKIRIQTRVAQVVRAWLTS